MAEWDLETQLQPISEDSPCGDNLEYDPAFIELERLAKGEEERQSGAELILAKDPEWKDVRRACAELLVRTMDLRVGVNFARAETALDGVAGLARGLALLRGYAERFWDSIHPLLEAEDDFDPIFRVNALASLASSDGLLGIVRRTALVEARTVGRFTFRDLDVAEQRVPAPAEGTTPTMALLSGALSDAGEEFARGRHASLSAALDDLRALDAVFRDKTSGAGPDCEPLEAVLRHGLAFLERGLPRQAEGGEAADPEAGGAADASVGAPGGAGKAVFGELRSREDAKRILEQVCVFLERVEPSNPAPILIRRAQGLLDRNFLEIIQNLAPEALAELQKLAGPVES